MNRTLTTRLRDLVLLTGAGLCLSACDSPRRDPMTAMTDGEGPGVAQVERDPAALQGRWELTQFKGKEPPELEQPISLEIDPEFNAGGFSGVNRYRISLDTTDLKAGIIRFNAGAGTLMAGPPAAMEFEQRYLAALERVTSYAIDGDVLRFYENNEEQLSFARTR